MVCSFYLYVQNLVVLKLLEDVFLSWHCEFGNSNAFRSCGSLLLFLHQSAFPKTDANLFEWAGTIEGAPSTVSHRQETRSVHYVASRVI